MNILLPLIILSVLYISFIFSSLFHGVVQSNDRFQKASDAIGVTAEVLKWISMVVFVYVAGIELYRGSINEDSFLLLKSSLLSSGVFLLATIYLVPAAAVQRQVGGKRIYLCLITSFASLVLSIVGSFVGYFA